MSLEVEAYSETCNYHILCRLTWHPAPTLSTPRPSIGPSQTHASRILDNQSGTWKLRFDHIGQHFDKSMSKPVEEGTATIDDMGLQIEPLRQQVLDLRQNQPRKREHPDSSLNGPNSGQGEVWMAQEVQHLTDLVMKYGKEKVMRRVEWM
jgi:hypothetical protein